MYFVSIKVSGELNMIRPYISEEEMKEEKKECNKKYYQDNREEILKKLNQKHICECGKKYNFCRKSRHCNTNKHKNFIDQENQEK